ncbi:MAG: GNAT family N-acetyltransferase [Phycisphaerales bacterium]|nr:GNAT family N-acetyltransferase [Phycisphaerales bacterium]
MDARDYDRERDKDAMLRIWREIGWIEDKKPHTEGMDFYLEACRTRVCEVHGEAEIAVSMLGGTMRVLEHDLPLAIVAGVYTGRAGRQQGHATALTAQCIAQDAAGGAAVASLGVFDTGFYDRLGFGTSMKMRVMTIDPRALKVPRASRPPLRLGIEDAEQLHACRLARRVVHGQVQITDWRNTAYEMKWNEGTFVLGYRDGPGGTISHFAAIDPGGKEEHGPYWVWNMTWSTREQLRELLGVFKSLGDQVHGFRMEDPPGISMQDLIDRPLAWNRMTRDSAFGKRTLAVGTNQNRICDLPRCVAAINLPGATLAFNLRLTDPIEGYLPADAPWRGVGGDWIVRINGASSAERGHDDALPTLEASVNAFTRLWLGGHQASALAISTDLSGPTGLIEALDRQFVLPTPCIDWAY